MNPRFLFDAHIIVRWVSDPKKLSREQSRTIRDSLRRHAPVAVSAMTLLEIAVLFDERKGRRGVPVAEILNQLDSHPGFFILPLTVEVATEVVALGPSWRDRGYRAIVATARVNGLRLITSDQRIIESGLVPVVC